jgi:hypothetical protein
VLIMMMLTMMMIVMMVELRVAFSPMGKVCG